MSAIGICHWEVYVYITNNNMKKLVTQVVQLVRVVANNKILIVVQNTLLDNSDHYESNRELIGPVVLKTV